MEDRIMGNKLLIAWLISLPILTIYLVLFDFNLYEANEIIHDIVLYALLFLPIYGCIRFIESYIIVMIHKDVEEEMKKNKKENDNKED